MDLRLADIVPADLREGVTRLRAELAGDGVGADLVAVKGGDGPVLLVIGAVHGDEYEGPVAIGELCDGLDPAEVKGTLLAVPVINEPAFYQTTRCGPDGENLARVFPGRADGSVTEQIAASLHALLARVDSFVDLHAAGTFYTLKPWAGYGLAPDAKVLETQRRMAFAFGLDFVWGTGLKPGRTLSSAQDHGVPGIYVEMTGSGLCRRPDVERNVTGLRDVMRAVGLLDGLYPTAPPPWWRESDDGDEGHLQVDHPAPRAGLFLPAVGLWTAVTVGQPLGVIRSPGGAEAVEVPALRDGRVAMLRTAPAVRAGEFVAVVVPV